MLGVDLLVLLDEVVELVVEAGELLLVGSELRRLALPWSGLGLGLGLGFGFGFGFGFGLA